MNTQYKNPISNNNIISNELYDNVVADYLETQSVRQTAKNCNTSMVTAQRILITEGLWSSKSSRQVKELYEIGKSIDQIAEELCLTRDTVYTYMPYSRGMYGMEHTDSAQYSKEYRNRMTVAAEGMHTHHPANSEPIAADNLCSDSVEMAVPFDHAQKGLVVENFGSVYALHLSLVGGFIYGADENLDMESEERAELLRLAKAKKGITRDILVPGEMNLHALHYAIQKLFGWQNSHLHNFSLSQEDFDSLTKKNFGEYKDLCGVLFRFPDDDLSDVYWDDDYKAGVSVKTWLRRKYSAPFRQLSVGDSWLGNQWEMEEFCDRFPEFQRDITLQDITEKVVVEQDFNYLTERLRIDEVLRKDAGCGRDEEISQWKRDVSDKVAILKEQLVDWDEEVLKDYASQLRIWRHNMDYIERMSWLNPDTYKEEIEDTFKKPYEDAVAEHKYAIKYWTEICNDILCEMNISPRPCVDTLYYRYDYGDDWCIKISLQEVYHRIKGGKYVDHDGFELAEDLESMLAEIQKKGKPVCVAADGLNLMDDCGGIYGYLRKLQTITGQDKAEAAEMRGWARSLGWTGRKSKPENIL
ncbi:MAG: helix-turn-helix domain-containing protein [Clostridiales bacterium]|nr:helix-turn-helix domain-containing protein [Clostridiales bacterium]